MIYAVKVKIGGIVMTKKILITGGAGYIGSHTALELLNEGTVLNISYNSI